MSADRRRDRDHSAELERSLLSHHMEEFGSAQDLMNATESINHPMVVSVFKDNAGAIEFYGGHAVTEGGLTISRVPSLLSEG